MGPFHHSSICINHREPSFTNGIAPVIFWMPLFPTILSIRSTVPGLNAIRCCALFSITSSDAGCICPSVGPPTCCSGFSGCSSGMFSAPRQQSLYYLNPTITRSYRRMTSNFGRLGTSDHVSAPSTCNAQERVSESIEGICTRIRQLTCALADRRSLEAKTPSSHLWLQPCSSRLVTVAPQQKYARKTSVRVDHVVRSMGRPLHLPRFLTRAR